MTDNGDDDDVKGPPAAAAASEQENDATMDDVQGPAAAAAATAASAQQADDDDATVARRLQTIDQLVQIFGFEPSVASEAVEAVGVVGVCCGDDANNNATTLAYNYILDHGLGQDQGGPVVPIENCPHIQHHVRITLGQLPIQPQSTICTYETEQPQQPQLKAATTTSQETTTTTVARLKADTTVDGRCPGTENWLCLECGVTRCSRYVNGHAKAHWQATQQQQDDDDNNDDSDSSGHCIACSLADLSVWCYCCNAYLQNKTVLDPIVERLEALKFGGGEIVMDDDGEPERKKARSEDDAAVDASQTGQQVHGESAEEEEESSDGEERVDDDEEEEMNISGDEADENLIEILRAAAAARGIPLEWIVEGEDDDDESQVDYPFEKPTSLEDVANFILSDKCKSVVVLAGAGMSVASGIPDFRSADGLYATMDPDLLTADEVERRAMRMDPTVALEQTLFLQNPLPCLELNREFILGTRDERWKATLAHRFVEQLHLRGKLCRLYTQNIDGLEDLCVQLHREKVIAVHGSMDRAECAMCKTESDFDWFAERVEKQIKDLSGNDPNAPDESTPIVCETCGCNTMKPAIVLFRSNLPQVFFDSVPKDTKEADLLIIIGTSLHVAPANSLVWRVPRSAMRVLVNREEVGIHLGMDFDDEESKRDYFAQGNCEEVIIDLLDHLGWLDDLESLLSRHQLPESSAQLLRERLGRSDSDKDSDEENGQV